MRASFNDLLKYFLMKRNQIIIEISFSRMVFQKCKQNKTASQDLESPKCMNI